MTRKVNLDVARLTACFEYLDGLRESGTTNMFGARSYLMKAKNLEADTASAVLSLWMETFQSDVTAADRARSAIDGGAA